jgi:sialidase-1
VIISYSASCKSSDSGVTPQPDPPEDTTSQEPGIPFLFDQNTHGYEAFRIPAIVKTKQGTLLAFAEARKRRSNGDAGDIDLMLKRSTDNGRTWSAPIIVWDNGNNTCGNPVPVVDQRSGDIHLLMTWNHGDDNYSEINNATGNDTRRVYVTRSTDDGLTWAAPAEITNTVKRPHWRWYGTGPCHGVQVKEGIHKNRLLIPCYYSVIKNGSRKDYSHAIYSDDGGNTWIPGDSTRQDNVGESTMAELPGGTLMLNMRRGTPARGVATSTDGGASWSDVQTDYALLDPQCQGSLLDTRRAGQHLLLFSNAASGSRDHMAIKMSSDGGATWSKSYSVYTGPAAYSDMVMISENEVAILYEAGVNRPYDGIAFKIISLDAFN